MKKRAIGLFIFFTYLSFSVFSQAITLCDGNQMNATPFCTDENPYGVTYAAGTVGSNAAELYYLNSTGCLCKSSGAPRPVWYKMRISEPGELNIYMSHTGGGDIDYACWGPFTDIQMSNMCMDYANNPYSLSNYLYDNFGLSNYDNASLVQPMSHNPDYSGYSTDHYLTPSGTLVDCSSTPYANEWVHIHNAQVGQWYILLISNWGGTAGNINFVRYATSTAQTDCSVTAPVLGDEVCVGGTATLTAQNSYGAQWYQWTGPNGFSQTTTTNTLTLSNVTFEQAGTYSLQVYNGYQYGAVTTCELIVHPYPVVHVAPQTICAGDRATLQVRGAQTYQWNTGSTDSNYVVSPSVTTTYAVTGTDYGMCSAFDAVTVTVLPLDTTEVPIFICDGDSYVFNGHTYTIQNDYYDTLTNAQGCDSIIITHLTVYPVYHFYDTAAICPGDMYQQHGFIVSSDTLNEGIHSFTNSYQSVHGCDSIWTLSLTILHHPYTQIYDTICAEEPYQENGFNIPIDSNSVAGTFSHQITVAGFECDSTVTLALTVLPLPELHFIAQGQILADHTPAHVCLGHSLSIQATGAEMYQWNTGDNTDEIEVTIDVSTMYYVTGTSFGRCSSNDSLWVELILRDTVEQDVIVCEGDGYSIGEHYYTIEGDYEDVLINQWGCDSIVHTHIQVAPIYHFYDTAAICPNESYQENGFYVLGNTLPEGEHIINASYQSMYGCDSIWTLMLTILHHPETYLWDTVCPGDDYQGYGFSISGSELETGGAYPFERTLPGYQCDSTVHLLLTVVPVPIVRFVVSPEHVMLSQGAHFTFTNTTSLTAISGYDYSWNWNFGDEDSLTTSLLIINHTYNTWGEYLVTLTINIHGCTSSVEHYAYVEDDLQFPNVITPNGDGFNDVFAIKKLNPELPNKFFVYDRWGKKVYEKENYKTYEKEGTIYNAESGFTAGTLSDGVFFYVFHYFVNNKPIEYHGTVTVIR